MVLDELDHLWGEIKRNLGYLDTKQVFNDSNYALHFLQWVREITIKNRVIYDGKSVPGKTDQEIRKRYRQHVYWVNLGKNVGSEFNDYHFAVVIRESRYTAIIVPLSTEKEDEAEWKRKDPLIIPIGEIELPKERKPAYAMLNQIRAVSKKRLDRYGNKIEGYYNIELTNDQMKLIDDAIIKYFVNS